VILDDGLERLRLLAVVSHFQRRSLVPEFLRADAAAQNHGWSPSLYGRAAEDAAHDTENGGVRADTERHGQDHRDREPAVPGKSLHRKPDVLTKRVHGSLLFPGGALVLHASRRPFRDATHLLNLSNLSIVYKTISSVLVDCQQETSS
jgi:hypothetical protein